MTKKTIDPIIVTAACEYVHSLLTNEEVAENYTVSKIIVESAQTLEVVLDILKMGDRYRQVCWQLNEYGEGTHSDEAVPMEKLNSPLFHKLIIATIELVALISERALADDDEYDNDDLNAETIPKLYVGFSDALNSFERETLLFNCLQVPSDDVKLAVAKCLDKVKLEEISVDEISHLVNLIKGQKNLGAGKTEEVLSLILLILTKYIQQDNGDADSFVARFSRDAIESTMEILMRDMARNLMNQPEEQEEKITLAISCLHFLKVISANDSVKSYFSSDAALQCMKVSLFCEEKLMPDCDVPIDVECTWIGRKVDHLFQCMTGDESILPYSLLSYRLISRIADVLSNKPEHPSDLDKSIESDDALRKDIKISIKDRIRSETKVWEDSQTFDSSEIKKEQAKKHFKEQHEDFSIYNGLDRLLTFLIGSEDSKLSNINSYFLFMSY